VAQHLRKLKGTYMISDHVHITKHIALSLTADDWELYHIDGREDAANCLNQAVAVALNRSVLKSQARTQIEAALNEYRQWGADDTEGHATVQRIWDLFYK
jgi:hypothetical protein